MEKKKIEWIKSDDSKPDSGVCAYVICQRQRHYDKKILQYQTMATYIAAMSVEWDEYMSDGQTPMDCNAPYCEENDCYYTPEGWYEYQTVPEINWMISDAVTHWHPLFEKPSPIELPAAEEAAQ